MTRIIGIDPGLRNLGWGLIEAQGSRLRHIDNGTIHSDAKLDHPQRLAQLHTGLQAVLQRLIPDEAAVEETFVNSNATSTLALGMARGIALLVPAQMEISVQQYLPNKVKKAVAGAGHADKTQVQMMVGRLLPGVEFDSPDAADALAVAICHAHLRSSLNAYAQGMDNKLATGGGPAKGLTPAQKFKRALMVKA